MSDAIKETGQHIDAAAEHHRSARASHAEMRGNLARVRDLCTRSQTAIAAGQGSKATALLDDLEEETGFVEASPASMAVLHRNVSRELDAAKRANARAVEEAGPAAHDPIANPSAAQGTQTSAGREPRSFDAESLRQRDQLAGCRLGYDARLRQLGVRR